MIRMCTRLISCWGNRGLRSELAAGTVESWTTATACVSRRIADFCAMYTKSRTPSLQSAQIARKSVRWVIRGRVGCRTYQIKEHAQILGGQKPDLRPALVERHRIGVQKSPEGQGSIPETTC